MKRLALVLVLILSLVRPLFAQILPFANLAHPLIQGQLAWWRGIPELSMSTRLYDLLGRTPCTLTNMGTLGTTSGWSVTTRRGGTMQLNWDGTGDWVDCGSDVLVDNLPLKSIALWANPASFGTGIAAFVDKRNAVGWRFGLNNSNVTAGISFIQDWNAQASPGNWCLANVITLNTWVHLGVTYDSTASGNIPTFYVNGEPFAPSTIVQSPSGTSDSDATSGLVLGAEDLGTGRIYQGAMDDIRLWTRILSAAEMREVYQKSLLGDPGLLLTPLEVVAVPSIAVPSTPGSFFPLFR